MFEDPYSEIFDAFIQKLVIMVPMHQVFVHPCTKGRGGQCPSMAVEPMMMMH
jgi:hypothetical protein